MGFFCRIRYVRFKGGWLLKGWIINGGIEIRKILDFFFKHRDEKRRGKGEKRREKMVL